MSQIILASSSPRRKELLGLLPIIYTIQTEAVDETLNEKKTPWENVMDLAKKKAEVIAAKEKNAVIIGSDTIVAIDGCILGKPKNEEDAKKMLKKLSGKWHSVYTGVCILHKEKGIKQNFYEETRVHMKTFEDEEIDYYVATGEPLDKAGAYGIQGKASLWIDKIEGDYFNVMGLPVSALYDQLKKIGEISY